jgi:hypothetical protein
MKQYTTNNSHALKKTSTTSMIRHANQRHTQDPNTCLIMKFHKSERGNKSSKLLALSPNPPISTLPIYLPLGNEHQKGI